MPPAVITAAMSLKAHTGIIFKRAAVAESPWMAGMTTCAAARTARMIIPICLKRWKPMKRRHRRSNETIWDAYAVYRQLEVKKNEL